MKDDGEIDTRHFKKKVYKHISPSDLACDVPFQLPSPTKKPKSLSDRPIQPKNSTLIEECKQLFLPLLIDVFQIRRKLDKHDPFTQFTSSTEGPVPSRKQLEEQLVTLKKTIQETKKWCDIVLCEIDKGLRDAKKQTSLLQKVTHWLRKPWNKKNSPP